MGVHREGTPSPKGGRQSTGLLLSNENVGGNGNEGFKMTRQSLDVGRKCPGAEPRLVLKMSNEMPAGHSRAAVD